MPEYDTAAGFFPAAFFIYSAVTLRIPEKLFPV